MCIRDSYGTESMHVLRAEKGFIIVGQDTDGSITPIDLGLTWMIGKNKKDFLGKRSLTRSDTIRSDRKQLVGIIPSDKKDSLEEGQHIILNQNVETPIPMLGHITSSYHSPTLGHSFGLAVIKEGHSLIGKKAYTSTSDQKTIAVEIVKPIFYDENNEFTKFSGHENKVLLVFFGYTHCPDVCPTTVLDMARVMKSLGDESSNVLPIFISVDYDRDDYKQVREYVNFFDTRIAALTSDKKNIDALTKFFKTKYEFVL